ncbi:MAG: hypothetical protein IKN91_09085 [Paludibacteraceae bacterium]|nr:hypothetical protein [Paludibacteraceae bacterium]
MKTKILLLISAIALASCASQQIQMNNAKTAEVQLTLSENNFRIVKHIEASAETQLNTKKQSNLQFELDNAKAKSIQELYKIANLKGSQQLVNIITSYTIKQNKQTTKITALSSGNIIEFSAAQHADTTIQPLIAKKDTLIQTKKEAPTLTKAATANTTEQKVATEKKQEKNLTSQNQTQNQQQKTVTNAVPPLAIEQKNDSTKNMRIYTRENFPDPSFYLVLLTYHDANKDGKLSNIEAEAIKKLEMPSLGVRDLKGVELLVNLEELNAKNNMFQTADLSKNKKLKSVTLQSKQIKKVYLPKNAKITCDLSNDKIARK